MQETMELLTHNQLHAALAGAIEVLITQRLASSRPGHCMRVGALPEAVAELTNHGIAVLDIPPEADALGQAHQRYGLPHARSDFRLANLRCKEVVEQFNRFLQQEQGMLQKLRASYGISDAGGR